MIIEENEVFCCGKRLGKYIKNDLYCCENCHTLMFSPKSPQQNLGKWIND